MLILAIWSLLSPNSVLISGINGAAANHAKKQTKKASQVTWNARICGVEKLNRSIRVAFGPVELTAGDANNMIEFPLVGW